MTMFNLKRHNKRMNNQMNRLSKIKNQQQIRIGLVGTNREEISDHLRDLDMQMQSLLHIQHKEWNIKNLKVMKRP